MTSQVTRCKTGANISAGNSLERSFVRRSSAGCIRDMESRKSGCVRLKSCQRQTSTTWWGSGRRSWITLSWRKNSNSPSSIWTRLFSAATVCRRMSGVAARRTSRYTNKTYLLASGPSLRQSQAKMVSSTPRVSEGRRTPRDFCHTLGDSARKWTGSHSRYSWTT